MKSTRLGLFIALFVLVLDQLSKWWALEALAQGRVLTVIPGFFDLVLAWNRGVSFSLFSSSAVFMPWVLSGVALIIVCVLLWWLSTASRLGTVWGIGMVIGGALGNLIDRLRFGAVIDFLDIYVANYHWPTFNIADCAVTVGVGIILLDGWRTPHQSC